MWACDSRTFEHPPWDIDLGGEGAMRQGTCMHGAIALVSGVWLLMSHTA